MPRIASAITTLLAITACSNSDSAESIFREVDKRSDFGGIRVDPADFDE